MVCCDDLFYSPASRVDCGNFTLVDGVDVEPYITTTVNSVIFYQCQQSGFAPSSTSSVCGEDEMWSPDPSRVMCDIVITTPTAGMVCLLIVVDAQVL